MFEALTWFSVGAFLCAPIAALLVYIYWVTERRVRIRETIIGYVLGVVLSGLILGFLGMYAGAYLTCAMIDDRNCGFGGVAVGAPLAAAIGVAVFILIWARTHRQHPNHALNADAVHSRRAG